ncbi:NtaA/DmoA family FMN-dependent monooxygenase [Pseudomonas entomophila]|uniref:NtaA/DmoA family FMN-dependent monooxygenase n=1 Tax=Pseudomonas entomophila TaxID=312306 RepID=UPI0023D869EC|nr:NtaA/DmoA family FMN-dependent monooxygenase [Pseudomonas entomophila]MDF0730115.1 NtaA/DmoA family FMN-dependent monooxygenase [Pseudomonas entomophila]
MSRRRHMHLALVIGDAGFHQAAWRQPGSGAEHLCDLGFFQRLAERAERAVVDSLFVADVAGFDPQSHASWPTNQFEPLTLLAALAAVTSRVGLIATLSTTYTPAYTLARQVLSLDHLSRGRAGVNIVTSRGGQHLYGLDELPAHSARYQRAAESLDAARALWDGWEPGAVLLDRAAGRYGDPQRIHEVDYQGEHVRLRGALPSPRSLQGRPVVVQAGASEEGRELAARYADVVFTMQGDAEHAASFYRDLKQRARAHGRDPEQLRVLQGVTPITAATEEAAIEQQRRLAQLTDQGQALRRLSGLLNHIDCSGLPLDQPLPPALQAQARQAEPSTAANELLELIARQRPLGDVLQRLVSSRGHWTPVGSHAQIAEQLQARFEAGATDGYVVLPADLLGSLDGLLEHVIPQLQQRQVLRSHYAGSTLREHLDLALPAWQPPVQGTHP